MYNVYFILYYFQVPTYKQDTYKTWYILEHVIVGGDNRTHAVNDALSLILSQGAILISVSFAPTQVQLWGK